MTMTFSDKYDWRGSKSIAKLATAGYQIAPWRMLGGWGGIRTHGTLAGTPVFKTGALNRSATHPRLAYQKVNLLRRENKREPWHPIGTQGVVSRLSESRQRCIDGFGRLIVPLAEEVGVDH